RASRSRPGAKRWRSWPAARRWARWFSTCAHRAERRAVEDSAFSDEFCRFIQTTVPSVGAAEVLLNLLRQPGRPWSAAEATREQPRDAIVSEDDARKWLELFAARGVVAQTPDGRFRYGPASADVDALVRILERAYNERP